MNRRKFLKDNALATAGLLVSSGMPELLMRSGAVELTILHTNDVHSRIDPFPASAGHLAGRGGAAARAQMIDDVRKKNEHVLLLDAGDIWQGTPYFNQYQGALEFDLMSRMGYDAVTLGNHDFDLGLEGLWEQWERADFSFICSNYDFDGTVLEGKTVPFQVREFGPLKVGLIGLGIELQGLVPDRLFGGVQWMDPIRKAKRTASILKRRRGVDFVIALSHLGYDYGDRDKPSDVKLAASSSDIDLILGGHTHTFLPSVESIRNKNGSSVGINQVGYGGAVLGRIDLKFDTRTQKKSWSCQNCWV